MNYLLNGIAVASGRNVLPELVQENRANYHGLSAEEKECLVEEFSQIRELKAVGIRLTSKSKINDVTHTLNAVENEVGSCFLYYQPLNNFSSCTISDLGLGLRLCYTQHAGQPIFHFEELPLQLMALQTSWAQ